MSLLLTPWEINYLVNTTRKLLPLHYSNFRACLFHQTTEYVLVYFQNYQMNLSALFFLPTNVMYFLSIPENIYEKLPVSVACSIFRSPSFFHRHNIHYSYQIIFQCPENTKQQYLYHNNFELSSVFPFFTSKSLP